MEHGLVGNTKQKLEALNKKNREAFGKETYTLDKGELEQYMLPPYKKATFLAAMEKPTSVVTTAFDKGVPEPLIEEKPFAFLPGILGSSHAHFIVVFLPQISLHRHESAQEERIQVESPPSGDWQISE